MTTRRARGPIRVHEPRRTQPRPRLAPRPRRAPSLASRHRRRLRPSPSSRATESAVPPLRPAPFGGRGFTRNMSSRRSLIDFSLHHTRHHLTHDGTPVMRARMRSLPQIAALRRQAWCRAKSMCRQNNRRPSVPLPFILQCTICRIPSALSLIAPVSIATPSVARTLAPMHGVRAQTIHPFASSGAAGVSS